LVSKIKGESVVLYEKTLTEYDSANRPVYTETPVTVENVLIGQPSTEDITSGYNLSGKQIDYVLAIPKGDTHQWTDRTVEFWNTKFRTVGIPTQGIEELIPLDWNKKVKVTAYE
jgi:hypothetical protein